MNFQINPATAAMAATGTVAVILAFRFLPAGAAEPCAAVIVGFLTSLQSKTKE